MTLPAFELHMPETIEEAVALAGEIARNFEGLGA